MVPTPWRLEVANAPLTAIRRGRLAPADRGDLLAKL